MSTEVGSFDQLTNASKILYPDKRVEPMVNVLTPFRRKLKRNLPSGATWTRGGILKYGGNLNPPQNIGQIADGDNLPTPVDRDDVQFQLTATLFPGTFQIGWLTRDALDTGQNAFNQGELQRRTNETIEDVAKHMERIYCGTHGTGRLCQVESDGSNTFVASKPEGTFLLRRKMRISARTTDGGDTVRDSVDNRTIDDLDEGTRTVTYSGADQTLVANDHIHVVTKASQTSLSSIAANGLRGLIDDATFLTTLHGLSRSTNPELKSVVNGNGGTLRDLNEQILIQTIHTVKHRSGQNVTDMWSNTGQAAKYVEFVAPDRRYQQTGRAVTELTTGYTEGTLHHVAPGIDLTLNIAYDIVPREIFLINWNTMFLYKASDLKWWDGGLLKPVPVAGGYKAGYFAALCAKENIGTDFPRANAVIRDLKDPEAGD